MIGFQLAVFASAFLLFLVQPLIAKQILPWFGGAPAVWSTSLVFFQMALVAGYLYAHVTRGLGIRRQVAFHLVLAAACILLLPIGLSAAWKPVDSSAPAARVFQLLAMTVGVPYVLLSATAPMLQDWYARARPGHTPYRLYALSNAGSLLALLSFPLAIEPYFDAPGQNILWSAVFVLFVAACGWCGWWATRQIGARPDAEARNDERGRPPLFEHFLWFALAACGTGLLLAVTNQLCQEVAAVPLLWVLPLALYLVTFIVCFAGRYSRWLWFALLVAGTAATAYTLAAAAFTSLPAQMASLLVLLGAGCMVCHGELARLKPAPEHLTSFYLALSVGGSVGGILVALAAPALFVFYAELPFFVVTTFLLFGVVIARHAGGRRGRLTPAFVLVAPLTAFTIVTVFVLRTIGYSSTTVAAARSFYGVVRVVDARVDGLPTIRTLYHGRVGQGGQWLEPTRRGDLMSDFAPGSGINVAFATHPRRLQQLPLRVAVIGLGAGAIAAFGREGDTFRFFELNPQVITFARTYFTYLADTAADVHVVPGDGRLSLEAELRDPRNQHAYDMLVVDAFSGASIPVHLLTLESFGLYRRALTPDGVLVVHVSNQHLDLTGVVRGTAATIGLDAVHVVREADRAAAITRSEWMVASASPSVLQQVRDGRPKPSLARRDPVVWTDRFSSITSVLR
jgi:hypothetical protein